MEKMLLSSPRSHHSFKRCTYENICKVIYPWVQIYYLVTDPSPSALHLSLVFILSVGSELYKEEGAAAAKSLQSCLTPCDPIDGSLPGSPVPGILQPLLPLETRPDSQGDPGMQPRDPCLPWRGTLGPGHKPR